ncbi:uncharacterized protein LOC124300255 [Neodiprion virginianus]|uniref:uncharacterized protein LOC124300255 n=1 Tax=Neodiprion virginianus TaxID=2961670 RepID=UPI001EE6BC76|nr:uncharacterized protein LOC124300255 [Neodiprion virginianus]
MRVTFLAVFAFTAVLFVGAIARPEGMKEPKRRFRRWIQERDGSRRTWAPNPLPALGARESIDLRSSNSYGDSNLYPSGQLPVEDLSFQEGAYGDEAMEWDRSDDFPGTDTGLRANLGLPKLDDARKHFPQNLDFDGDNEISYQQGRNNLQKYDQNIDNEYYDNGYDDYEEDLSDPSDTYNDESRSDVETFYPEEHSKSGGGNSVQRDGYPAASSRMYSNVGPNYRIDKRIGADLPPRHQAEQRRW